MSDVVAEVRDADRGRKLHRQSRAPGCRARPRPRQSACSARLVCALQRAPCRRGRAAASKRLRDCGNNGLVMASLSVRLGESGLQECLGVARSRDAYAQAIDRRGRAARPPCCGSPCRRWASAVDCTHWALLAVPVSVHSRSITYRIVTSGVAPDYVVGGARPTVEKAAVVAEQVREGHALRIRRQRRGYVIGGRKIGGGRAPKAAAPVLNSVMTFETACSPWFTRSR